MKIKIKIRPDVGASVYINAEINKSGFPNVATADLLFADIEKANVADLHREGFELHRWSIKRNKTKTTGLAGDKSPTIADGDAVTFFVRKRAS